MATSIDDRGPRAARHARRDPFAEAKSLNLDVTGLDEAGARRAVGKEQARQYYAENRESVDAYNAWIKKNGLPLDKYRLF
ncbi:type II toxin-antitoxin system CcdA family antitoxin [Sphingomonas oligophenolica]|uniref:Post-segregation antitoxin CcdA n=1 Tax=Sphingomonas oligophenolica TaxID=301154 RepID=A0A502CUF0_9SPHN|nr:type II toxin-antitoxin system CcdA family antitoxin [Sphingomonas oligophenolica]TPG15446.1 post-segregation antitoxin CcdA [Sphingomonas oligophenolica]